jgi:ADP-ribose pyrophosphatase YjhB (NUDIX family)
MSPAVQPGETPEQALERRLRESARVEERVVYISDRQEWEQELQKVGRLLSLCRSMLLRLGSGGRPSKCVRRKGCDTHCVDGWMSPES